MRITRGVFSVLIAASIGLGVDGVAGRQTASADVAAWQEDLDYLAREFKDRQKDFAKLYPNRRFENSIADLKRRLPTETDAGVTLDLMRLVASANVAHTNVGFPQGARAFPRLPIAMAWYSDGLAVTAASDEARSALGTRVQRIGSRTPAELESAVAPYIAHENEWWLHQQSPAAMTMMPLLERLGAVDAHGRVRLTLARPGGQPFDLTLGAGSPNQSLTSMFEVLPIPAMLYRRNPQRLYWFEYLEDSKTLYIQYDQCRDDPALPFADFAKQVFELADSRPVERTIVDVRFNQGGNSSVIKPLIAGLAARRALIARGRLLALIGRATFSSGLMAAVELKNTLGAVLVGEPTGEKLNSYGMVDVITLPRSGLRVQYSTRFFELSPSGDPPALMPDVTVRRSLEDALAGRDPALDVAIRGGR